MIQTVNELDQLIHCKYQKKKKKLNQALLILSLMLQGQPERFGAKKHLQLQSVQSHCIIAHFYDPLWCFCVLFETQTPVIVKNDLFCALQKKKT